MGRNRSLNVLLVEASTDQAAHLARLLSGDGHAVCRAGTLAEANELCEDGRFDLLIASTHLPDGAACELLAAGAGPCNHIPGILITSDGDHLCTATLAFRARLTRPVDLPTLRRAVARATAP